MRTNDTQTDEREALLIGGAVMFGIGAIVFFSLEKMGKSVKLGEIILNIGAGLYGMGEARGGIFNDDPSWGLAPVAIVPRKRAMEIK
jgi:hypothetical protein